MGAVVDSEAVAKAIEQRRFLMTELLETGATYIADLEQCYAYIKQVIWFFRTLGAHYSFVPYLTLDLCVRARSLQNLRFLCLRICGRERIA